MCEFCEDPENFSEWHVANLLARTSVSSKARKWDERYLAIAEQIGSWSKDPSSKIGAVVIGEHGQILSTGYNGFPRKIADTPERLNDRPTKYSLVIHAEMNAIYNAALTRVSIEGGTLYVAGLPPCSSCALGIIQSGIARVVCREADINKSDKWREEWSKTQQLLTEAGVEFSTL